MASSVNPPKKCDSHHVILSVGLKIFSQESGCMGAAGAKELADRSPAHDASALVDGCFHAISIPYDMVDRNH